MSKIIRDKREGKKMFNRFITCANDLVTTHEQTRTGFLKIALEKNMISDPYVKRALAFKAMVTRTSSKPSDLLKITDVRPFLLTAAGLSDKSMNYLTESDQTEAIKELIKKFLEPAGEEYIDEAIFRYLLIKGDAVGGTMRNRIGALGQERLIRSILSCLCVRGMEYQWVSNDDNSKWIPHSDNDFGIEKTLKALHWKSRSGDRTLGFNLKILAVNKNVDICLFKCCPQNYDQGKIASQSDKVIMLGELKGGIDPAGADEHWKTANTALSRIRTSFSSIGMEKIKTSFVGAAIATAMAKEIYEQLQKKILTNAANLTNTEQMTEFCNWVLSL